MPRGLQGAMVRLRRLELPRGVNPTATSTLRVYQFRHSRTQIGRTGSFYVISEEIFQAIKYTPFMPLPNLLPQGMNVSTSASLYQPYKQFPQVCALPGLTPYPDALIALNTVVEALKDGHGPETIMLLEHPPLYTGGTSAQQKDLLKAKGIDIFSTGRGGQWTYHGPGQRIIWPVLDLRRRKQDIRLYVHQLESWMIDILAGFGVYGVRRAGLPGIWVKRPDIGLPNRLDKIAAIGIRISRWVTSHGIAINLEPNLSHYDGIVPCGVADGGITSLADLGLIISQDELDMAIQDCFSTHFGPQSSFAYEHLSYL